MQNVSKNAYGIANSVDPDQTAPFWEQSDLGLHSFLRLSHAAIFIIFMVFKVHVLLLSP